MSLGMELGLGPGDFVLNGDPAPQKGGGTPPPRFSAHVYCGQTAGWMKVVLGMEVGLSPGDFVFDGYPVPFPQKGAELPPQFSAHFYCGQTARCIKMPLGIDVGLSQGDFVLVLLCQNCWMHQDATGYGGRPQHRRVCVRWGPSPLPKKGRSPLPNFKDWG